MKKNNPHIGLVVFTTESDDKEKAEKTISPLYITKKKGAKEVLLLVHNNHFCVIKNENGLLRKSNSSHNKAFVCRRCMVETYSEDALATHERYCSKFDYTATIYPEEGKNHVEFRNFHKMHKVPITIYADFECFLEKIKKYLGIKTEAYQRHKPSGFCYYVIRFDGKNHGRLYTGPNAGKRFTQEVEKVTREFYEEFKTPKPIINMDVANAAYKIETHCYACGGELGSDRVQDHCHYTGKFRGIAHNKCNLAMREHKFIPVFFHNLAKYDEKLFLRELGWEPGKIECIAKNAENFISFSKKIVVDTIEKGDDKTVEVTREIRFLDSFKFMASSLSKLVDNLKEFPHLKGVFADEGQFELMKRKGVFPHD